MEGMDCLDTLQLHDYQVLDYEIDAGHPSSIFSPS
jgi:hypothetical protein